MPTAIITGASSGLGKAIAHSLRNDFTVIDWSLETGVDVTDGARIMEAAAGLPAVDVLVNCAGVNYIAPFDQLTKQSWDHLMDVNAWAIVNCTQALLPQLAGGTIVNIISRAAIQPMTYSLLYNASKAAAAMMTRQMAHELHNIIVFGISPGWLAGTGMTNKVDARLRVLRNLAPPPARIDPAAIADLLAWLLQSKQRHRHLHGSIIEYGQ